MATGTPTGTFASPTASDAPGCRRAPGCAEARRNPKTGRCPRIAARPALRPDGPPPEDCGRASCRTQLAAGFRDGACRVHPHSRDPLQPFENARPGSAKPVPTFARRALTQDRPPFRFTRATRGPVLFVRPCDNPPRLLAPPTAEGPACRFRFAGRRREAQARDGRASVRPGTCSGFARSTRPVLWSCSRRSGGCGSGCSSRARPRA
jgi:hypothetical protein